LTADATGYSEAAEKEAASVEQVLERLEAQLKASPNDAQLEEQTRQARADARQLRLDAGERAGLAAIRARDFEQAKDELTWLDQLRRAAYALEASDVVAGRFNRALRLGALAVALVAVGVILLALAPEPKEPDTSTQPTLVTLKLTDAGKAALGCSALTIQAIRVGGGAETPRIITVPTSDCATAKLIDFKVTNAAVLGSVEETDAIQAK
jgi:hypothetical protein